MLFDIAWYYGLRLSFGSSCAPGTPVAANTYIVSCAWDEAIYTGRVDWVGILVLVGQSTCTTCVYNFGGLSSFQIRV